MTRCVLTGRRFGGTFDRGGTWPPRHVGKGPRFGGTIARGRTCPPRCVRTGRRISGARSRGGTWPSRCVRTGHCFGGTIARRRPCPPRCVRTGRRISGARSRGGTCPPRCVRTGRRISGARSRGGTWPPRCVRTGHRISGARSRGGTWPPRCVRTGRCFGGTRGCEEGRRHFAAAQAAESAALALADDRRHLEAAAQAASLEVPALADECLRAPTAEARPLVVAVRRDTATVCATAAPASPDRVPAAIRRLQAARDTLAAPLDALLAEFAELAVDLAPPTTMSPVPTATLTSSPRPRTYLDAVVGPGGRGYTLSAPPSPPATSSPPSASGPTTPSACTNLRAKPHRCTGRRNGPWGPSSPGKDTPSHPTRLMGGSLAMAQASHHPAALGNAGGTSSKGGIAHPSPVHGLSQPRTHARRKRRPHRVCRRHGPRAPNLLEPLPGGRGRRAHDHECA